MSLPEKIMDSLLKVKRFQDWVNCRFELCDYKWQVSPNRSTIAQALKEYRFYDLRKTLDKANFEYEFEKINESMALVHATKKEN